MKCIQFAAPIVLMALSAGAFAQSSAQKSFDQLKTLVGTWQGKVTTIPKQTEMGAGATVRVTMRVTSTGHAILHEIRSTGAPDDPITMIYTDGDRLLLTHYCDAGNRPRMVAHTSPNGKTVEFDFLDLSGGTENGYMRRAVFTSIDANHHTEDWTYMEPGNKPVRAHLDLWRTKDGSGASVQ